MRHAGYGIGLCSTLRDLRKIFGRCAHRRRADPPSVRETPVQALSKSTW
jgi:hypothetical protein